jgi:TRAP-type C4-dicarboxylate transport system permease small subunit
MNTWIKFTKGIDRLSIIGGHVSAYMVAIMMFLVLYEVVMRYFFSKSPLIADELSRYLLIALSFIGMSYVWREEAHVRVEALVTKLPPQTKRWLRLGTVIIAFIFVVAVIYGSFEFLERSVSQNRRSDSWMRIPLIIPEITIVMGFFLLAFQMLVSITKIVTGIYANEGMEGGHQ